MKYFRSLVPLVMLAFAVGIPRASSEEGPPTRAPDGPGAPTFQVAGAEPGQRETPAASEPKPDDGVLAILTGRETDIVQRVANGASDKEMAEAFGLSRSMINNALLVMHQKWCVRSRTEAVVKFTRRTGRRT